MFLSLKRHMDGSSTELTDALVNLSQLLLRSMRLHVVRSDASAVQRYQGAVLTLEKRLTEPITPADVAEISGEAALVFEDYCAHTNRFLDVQSGELAKMLSMLTSTVSSISAGSLSAVANLGKVEKRIETLSYASDLPKLKMELADCLAMVREESFRQRERNAETIHSLQRGMSDTRRRIAEASEEEAAAAKEPLMPDALTSLPGRADAEDALVQSRAKKNFYAAVLPVDRLGLVNSRFGTKSTDMVVTFFADHLKRHLHAKDQLFRWSANSFLALVERTQTQDSVRADLSRFASAKLELTLEHHGREIRVPVSSTWVLFSAAEGRTHEALVAKIDGFLKSDMHLKDSF
ncbi:MAG: diguanylate cyclase [Bryobacterales bacterium]|nr:diguanylate cyclase [Bryobacterales bacterium]